MDELRRCASRFRTRDSFVPRWLALLSDELLGVFIDLFVRIEAIGCWPHEVSRTIAHLVPKPSGGRRPMGVLATITRIWEAIQKPVVWRWRAANIRPYNWAAAGRSAEGAIWAQTLEDEAAIARGYQCGAVLFDLVKAYEMVKLELVWREGMAMGFPPLILRLALESFAFTRTLSYHGAVAEGVETLSAILASSALAQDGFVVVVMKVVDRARTMHPLVGFVLYVDDLSAHAREGTA